MLALLLAIVSTPTFACHVASVHDGDTMRCADGTRIRLQGIDANELDGSCHHTCARGTADQARRHLDEMALDKVATCTPTGHSYNRVTAWCTVRSQEGRQIDLSCDQVATKLAVIWRKFDPRHRLDQCTAMQLPSPRIP